MTVTFRAEPNELSFIAFDYHLECVVEPRRDRRVFATYEQALAGLCDHHRYCAGELCFPDAPFVVSRTAADDEPSLNVTTTGAVLLLRALGLLPELGADAVTDAADDPADRAGVACCPSAGRCARQRRPPRAHRPRAGPVPRR